MLAIYGVTAILSLLLAVNHLRLWKADLRTPLVYGHDACIVHMWVKTIIDNPWSFSNEYLGSPGVMEMQDFPLASNLHFLFMKAMTVFTRDPFLIVNLYYLLTFPLIACSFLFLMRSLSVRWFPAVVFSLVYCLLPGHFWRGTAHLFLSAYFMIPLFTCMVGWLLLDDRYLIYRRDDTGKLAIAWRSPKTWFTLVACVAVGSDFPYYPLFAIILGPFAVAIAIYLERSRRVAIASVVLIGLVACSFAANLAPTLLYHARNGSNPSELHVTNHPWSDGEDYGLKVTQLLLPTDHHILNRFRQVRDEYYVTTRIPSEADAMALGAVASLGFIGILLRLLCPDLGSPRGRMFYLLGVLTVVSVLFASVGGFGTMVNLLGLRTTRTYNRMSMFIACFALVGIALWFDAVLERVRERRTLRSLSYAMLLALLVVAGFENTKGTYLVPRASVVAEFQNDAAFVRAVEASVPPDSKIFQLPYISYCSYANAQGKMQPYDHFRGYLHSKTLRWSFGAMHGRPTDQLHARLTTFPLPDRVEALIALGFEGIYLDRLGYADKKFEAELASLLAVEPITSGDGRFAYYSLADRAASLEAHYSPAELRGRFARLMEDPSLIWGKGCYAEETDAADLRWRWCGSKGMLAIRNYTDHPIRRTLRFSAYSYDAGGGTLTLSGPLFEDRIEMPPAGGKFSREIDIPPGSHRIDLSCSAKPYLHPARTLVFMVRNYELIDAAAEK